MVPLYLGGEASPGLRSRASPNPFGASLIHCYSLKPAEMRAFLHMGGGDALNLTPPAPALARGACAYN